MTKQKLVRKKKTGYSQKPSTNLHLGFVAHFRSNDGFENDPKCGKGQEKNFDPRKYPANEPIETKKK